MQRKIEELARANPKGHFEPVTQFAVATPDFGHINRQDEGFVSGCPGPLGEFEGPVAIAAEVELESCVAVRHVDEFFHRRRGHRRNAKRDLISRC